MSTNTHPTDRQISHPYADLTPELILQALESVGHACDGRLLALNSYENRVYQIGVEDGPTVVAKFYRPERWSDAAILEEHDFARALAARQIPVVPPLADEADTTLHRYHGFRFAVYPRSGGRWPELDAPGVRAQIGRMLGRLHAVGMTARFRHRGSLDVATFGDASRTYLLENGWVSDYLVPAYESLTSDLLSGIRERFAQAGDIRSIRLHGDCHPGNILWNDDGPHFVDLDDCRMGPAVQDLWMLLAGETDERRRQLEELLEGYQTFADFDYRELHLIEALRTLRIMHYTAWIARRWNDPAFPIAFPWFDSPRYWEEHILSLREQAAALEQETYR